MSGLFPTKCDVFQFEKTWLLRPCFALAFSADAPPLLPFSSRIIIYRIIISQICFRIAFHLSLDDSTRNCEHGVMEVAFHVLTNSHYILTCIEFIWKFARLSAAEEGREVAANTFSSSSSPPPSLHPPPPPPPSSPPPPPSTPQDSSNFTCP